ncbi:MAG: GAF domain-containing protein [Paracoccaceae bacterium]
MATELTTETGRVPAAPATAPLDGPRTFIEVTEVWVPDATGERLVLASGIYGDLAAFAAASGQESFARGEGLPGKAWDEARPVVLKAFRGSYFKRTEAAEAAGLTAGVAVPIFAGDRLKAVLTVLCAADEIRTGAIEVWHAASGSDVLTLEDGYYGAASHFEWVSQRTEFPRGLGLPGGVWAAGAPILMRDLGAGYRFIRAESAGRAGLTTGLGLPVPSPAAGARVLALLSARGTPIARRFEVWEVVPARGDHPAEAVLVDGLCAREGPLWGTPQRVAAWRGPLGEAVATGLPLAREGVAGLPGDHRAMVAFPVHTRGELSHIAAWYL